MSIRTLLTLSAALLALSALPACEQSETASSPEAEAALSTPKTLEDLQAAAPRGKLPSTARPLAYDLDLTLDPREAEFSGAVRITIELAKPADGVWIHGETITVSDAEVAGADGETHKATYTDVLPSGVVWVDFGREMPAGPVDVTLTYSAPFDTNLSGLFRVDEQGDAYALAKSESIQARKFLPGFDEPGLKAPFTISLLIPKGYEAISNAPIASRVDVEEGFERVTFEPTRPMSTYLLSLAVGPFDVVERPPLPANSVRTEEIPLRGIARKGRGADLAYILDITPDFMRIFEESLGVPYPYKKLDIVAAPQWPSGATELSAAITYREQSILADGTPPPGQRLGLISVHAHEIAHMWFGNLVTPPWWDDLWLKEGFASWGTPMALTQWEPEAGHGLNAVASSLRAMRADSLSNVRAVREPITENEDIRNAYTAIPYSKGLALIRMVETYFGVETFRLALGDYIKAHEDGIADSDQFFETIGEVTGNSQLTDVFRGFVDQKGVPFVDVGIDCESADAPQITLSQSRYAPLGSKIETSGNLWSIPFNGAGAAGENWIETKFIFEGKKASASIDACPAWFMPNQDGTGYYRWTLPTEYWAALVERFDALSPGEALVTLDSAVAGFEAGKTGGEALLAVLRPAALSPTRQVAEGAMSTLSGYINRLGEEQNAPLIAYARALYMPLYEAMSDPQTADEILLKQRIEGFLAGSVKEPSIRAALADAASRFVGLGADADPAALNSDRYATALSVAVQDLGAPFFDKLIEARETMDDPRFERASASAIGNVKDPELSARALAYALSDKTGPREAYSIIQGQMGMDETREAAWVWLQENIEAVTKVIPGQWRRRLPTLASSFCETDRIAEIATFFKANAALYPGYERQLTQAQERIELCAALTPQLETQLLPALTD